MTKLLLKSAALFCIFTIASLTHAAEALSRALNSKVSVSGHMSIDKFQQLLKDGYRSVIVNQPDQEQGNAVSVSQLRNIAEKSHVSVIYQPVVNGQLNQANVNEFAKYYNELPKPILMICRTGARSADLFNQAKAQGLLHE
ncbi:hypothetical protein A3K93_10155 [Acinetobacter sp. NCu2D-2]|uniref:beta-lactamase hydrolase domain-containing protein n=1 Tax=Acinetobacter sp. NCu2D-2 TaxID=1608473 RepID=UPI0007CDABC3|nr:sulfur transferase domain-containing protein [Acinetobacter sp. NCu2D-2]ANF82519.1 hypothetical protein A3K93_10155 [Acinetobacter sp. NCu2D-2]